MFKNWNTGTAGENQDGGTGRHTAPPRKTKRRQQFKINKQPELTENRTARKSDNQGDKEETIQTGRRGRDSSWAERTQGKVVAGRPTEVVDCGAGQARLQLSDPTRWWMADLAAPHSPIDKPGGMAGE